MLSWKTFLVYTKKINMFCVFLECWSYFFRDCTRGSHWYSSPWITFTSHYSVRVWRLRCKNLKNDSEVATQVTALYCMSRETVKQPKVMSLDWKLLCNETESHGCKSIDTQAISTEDISYSMYFRTSLFGTQTISDSNHLWLKPLNLGSS